MTQIITNNGGGGGGGGGGGTQYSAGNGIDITSNEISIDEAVVQTVDNMVEDLDNPDNAHYPTSKAVKDAITSAGGGDVSGPASSTDGDVVLFDGATGKLIKDSGVGLSSKLDASALSNNNYGGAWQGDSTHTPTKGALYDKIHTMDVEIGNKAADNTVVKLTGNQTINGTKTFGTSPVVPSKTTDATNTGTAIATEAQVYNVAEDVATINSKIPSAATSSNQLADKDYVNDGINSVTAYYITKNAQGDQWATYAELAAATTFYSGGVVRVPTKNDYTIVLADENHDNATTRYIYNSGWEYQYTVNETALTQAQLDALNSGITSGKVSTYDGYASTISGKQDALTLPATPTSGHLVTWGADNKTFADGGAIPTIVYATQAEYTALLPGAESDGKHYFIYHSGTIPVITTAGIYWDDVNGLISIQDGNGNGWTIRDRNEGATNVGDVGCHYQRGNNYGFIWENGAISNGTISSTRVDASTYGPDNPYSSSTFISINNGGDWSTVQNDNLWGNTTNTAEARKGPCSSGYHIPSYSELNGLINLIKNTWGRSYTMFNTYLKIPATGNISWSGASLSNNSYGFLWTSSPVGTNSYRYTDAYNIGMGDDLRNFGECVRAFKNSFETPTASWEVIYQPV